METDWVKNEKCQQCGKEGSKYHRFYQCVVHKRIRSESRRDVSSHQQQAATSEERMIRERGLSHAQEQQDMSGRTQNTTKKSGSARTEDVQKVGQGRETRSENMNKKTRERLIKKTRGVVEEKKGKSVSVDTREKAAETWSLPLLVPCEMMTPLYFITKQSLFVAVRKFLTARDWSHRNRSSSHVGKKNMFWSQKWQTYGVTAVMAGIEGKGRGTGDGWIDGKRSPGRQNAWQTQEGWRDSSIGG